VVPSSVIDLELRKDRGVSTPQRDPPHNRLCFMLAHQPRPQVQPAVIGGSLGEVGLARENGHVLWIAIVAPQGSGDIWGEVLMVG
jgi:hypothetical protein